MVKIACIWDHLKHKPPIRSTQSAISRNSILYGVVLYCTYKTHPSRLAPPVSWSGARAAGLP